MKLWLALKAFFKAWKEPLKAEVFINEQVSKQVKEDPSHLRLLSLLQQKGRLIDFFKEDISSYTDVQIGMAVRKIHQDCAKSLEELVTIRPLLDESEGASLTIASGYDPAEIKLVGNIKGGPPFHGKVLHRGWKAHKRSLPKMTVEEISAELLMPAEIEVK